MPLSLGPPLSSGFIFLRKNRGQIAIAPPYTTIRSQHTVHTMISTESHKLIQGANYRHNYPMRALASYYRQGAQVHPDPGMTGHFMVPRDPSAEMTDFLEYIRLANIGGTLAVYRVTNRGELKRLKRWPQSVEAGSAETYAQFNDWLNDCLDKEDEKVGSGLSKLDNDDLTALLDCLVA